MVFPTVKKAPLPEIAGVCVPPPSTPFVTPRSESNLPGVILLLHLHSLLPEGLLIDKQWPAVRYLSLVPRIPVRSVFRVLEVSIRCPRNNPLVAFFLKVLYKFSVVCSTVKPTLGFMFPTSSYFPPGRRPFMSPYFFYIEDAETYAII